MLPHVEEASGGQAMSVKPWIPEWNYFLFLFCILILVPMLGNARTSLVGDKFPCFIFSAAWLLNISLTATKDGALVDDSGAHRVFGGPLFILRR